MRIVLSGEGTRGDLYPLLALGEACRDAGHQVSVCAPPNFAAEVAARGFPFHPSGIDVQAYLTEWAGALIGGGLAFVRAHRAYQASLMAHAFTGLYEATEGADLLVAAGVQIAGSTVAARRGIPFRYLAYCPSILPSAQHAPAFLPARRTWPRWLNRLAWRFLMPLIFRPIVADVNRKRAEVGVPPERDAFRMMLGEAPVLLAADAELAPAPGDCPVPLRQIGALQTDVEGPLPGKLETFLAAGPAPVYLGFGSMTDPEPARTTAILLEAIERAGCRALVSKGWAGLGGGPLPEHVFELEPVSHARLFPRVAAVVHHGGAGTTTTAARAGARQIVVPHLLDQHYWARRVVELGVAPPPVYRRGLCPRLLADTIRATLDNEWLEHNARELGTRLRATDPLHPKARPQLVARVLSP